MRKLIGGFLFALLSYGAAIAQPGPVPGVPPCYNAATGCVVPQGRLTLTSGQPVMKTTVASTNAVYYDCKRGPIVPIYNGRIAIQYKITGCELTLSLANATNFPTTKLFDVFVFNDSGTLRLCAVPWTTSTAGSSARATAIHQSVTGYWTNVTTPAHCYNGATEYGTSVVADTGTYLGSFYTTTASHTTMQIGIDSGTGGDAPCMCLFDAYSDVVQSINNQDTTASPWTYSTATWRSSNNSALNRVTVVDGLGQATVRTSFSQTVQNTGSPVYSAIGVCVNATNCTPTSPAALSTAPGYDISIAANYNFVSPQAGLNYIQAMERCYVPGVCIWSGNALGGAAVTYNLTVSLQN